MAASNASSFGNPRQMQTLVQVMETVVEVSLIPIKWGPYAETQEARREAEESAATRTSEGLETNLGLFGRARVGSQTVKRWAADGMPLHREGQFVSIMAEDRATARKLSS